MPPEITGSNESGRRLQGVHQPKGQEIWRDVNRSGSATSREKFTGVRVEHGVEHELDKRGTETPVKQFGWKELRVGVDRP